MGTVASRGERFSSLGKTFYAVAWILLCVTQACGPIPPTLRMPEANPWRVPAEEFALRAHTVCIFPTSAPIEELEDRAQEFGRLAAQELRGAGLKAVVLSEEDAQGLLEHAVADVGGVVDPEVGWVDMDRVHSVVKRQRELARQIHGCDAFLGLSVVMVRAPFSDGLVKWDGREAKIQDYLSAMGNSGWTTVLSLHARVSDLNNEELYFFAGGIQPVIEVKTFPLPYEPIWRAKNPEELLLSESDNHRAVLLALGPLLPAVRGAAR